MSDFIAVEAPGVRASLGAHPVTIGAFREFLRETARPTPVRLKQVASRDAPVICISQEDAGAYCAWLRSREGRGSQRSWHYRLPTVAELQTLMEDPEAVVIEAGVWPHHEGQVAELIGGLKPIWLCEWTAETVTLPASQGRAPRALGVIFYPPWMREGNNVAHVHASLLASEGYSFVTFRLAFDG